MRVLFGSVQPFLPALSGAEKGNRAFAEGLARLGHEVRVVTRARAAARPEATLAEFHAHLRDRGITFVEEGACTRFRSGDVELLAHDRGLAIPELLKAQVAEYRPDFVITSTEDFRNALLHAALEVAPDRVVYTAHAITLLPVGPDSAEPAANGAELLRRVRAVIAPSRHTADYVERWAGVRADVVYPPVFSAGPNPDYGNPDRGAVLLINPSAIKGISIFLALADAFPDVPFACVASWATTAEDRAALAARPNVTLLPASERIDDFFSQARVLLVPSLCNESFSLVVIEAMLRGLPVLASNAGGIPEAKLGTDLLIPVQQIQQMRMRRGILAPVEIPPQDLSPWKAQLGRLLSDRGFYRAQAAAARAAADTFVAGVSVEPLERVLVRLQAERGR